MGLTPRGSLLLSIYMLPVRHGQFVPQLSHTDSTENWTFFFFGKCFSKKKKVFWILEAQLYWRLAVFIGNDGFWTDETLYSKCEAAVRRLLV